MQMSRSLNAYLAVSFVTRVGAVFAAAYLLMLAVDIMEITRRTGEQEISFLVIAGLSAMRLPALAEQLVPFAVLIGAVMTLVALSRQSELIIARASGLSAWQFLLPLLVAALILGFVAALVYNPVSASLKARSDSLLADLLGGAASQIDPEREIWFRQSVGSSVALVRAAAASDGGQTLHDFTAMVFGEDGTFVERIDAPLAILSAGRWTAESATRTDRQGTSQQVTGFELATPLTPDDVLGRFTPASAVPIWSLPGLAEKAQRAGIAADRYQFQFQALLARPMLLMAMVLVAATVSLRFSRHGGTTRLVVTGLSAGFIVFVVNEIAGDLGGAGLISPFLAAWVPPLAAALFGVTALLHMEDG